MALFPFGISRNHFRNLWLLAAAYTGIVLVITTIDIVRKSRLRCHADPVKIVRAAEAFWRKSRPGGIPVVVGERWICGVIQFYSPEHPQACSESDPYTLKPVLAKIRREGALLLGYPDAIRKWLPELAGKVKFEYFPVEYRARWGKLKEDEYYIAVYPGEERP